MPQAYAAHVARSYLKADVRGDSSIHHLAQLPRAAVDAVLDNGGWVPDHDLDALCEEIGISQTTLSAYINGRVRNGRRSQTYLRHFDGGVGVIPCPHDGCDGSATIVNLLPEISRELLCGTCSHMPDTDAAAIVFPEEYLPRVK